MDYDPIDQLGSKVNIMHFQLSLEEKIHKELLGASRLEL